MSKTNFSVSRALLCALHLPDTDRLWINGSVFFQGYSLRDINRKTAILGVSTHKGTLQLFGLKAATKGGVIRKRSAHAEVPLRSEG